MPQIWQPQFAVDGMGSTRYATCTAGVPGDWFQVDLQRTVSVGGVVVDDMADPADVAAAWSVQVSMDGTNWTTVAMSSTAAPPVLTVTFTPVMARFVRFNQNGNVGITNADGGFTTKWWSIHEFNVLCGLQEGGTPPPDAGADSSTTDSSTTDSSSSDSSTGDAAADALVSDAPIDAPVIDAPIDVLAQ
jgi:hypothetical protein